MLVCFLLKQNWVQLMFAQTCRDEEHANVLRELDVMNTTVTVFLEVCWRPWLVNRSILSETFMVTNRLPHSTMLSNFVCGEMIGRAFSDFASFLGYCSTDACRLRVRKQCYVKLFLIIFGMRLYRHCTQYVSVFRVFFVSWMNMGLSVEF